MQYKKYAKYTCAVENYIYMVIIVINESVVHAVRQP